MFRKILENSHLNIVNGEKILVYDVGAYNIFQSKALWLLPALADPLQTLPKREMRVAIRWLKSKNITMWMWSDDVWDLIYKEFNDEKTKE